MPPIDKNHLRKYLLISSGRPFCTIFERPNGHDRAPGKREPPCGGATKRVQQQQQQNREQQKKQQQQLAECGNDQNNAVILRSPTR